jgi:hypothetical protein
MKASKIICAVGTVLFCTSLSLGQQSAPSSDITERQINVGNLNHVTIVNAATRAFIAAGVPGGIASNSTCGAEETYDFVPSGRALPDVLGSIVSAEPRYRWYVDHDVANLIYSSGEPTLLDVVISEFSFDRSMTEDEVVQRLLETPDVREGIIKLRLVSQPAEIGLRSLARPGSPTPQGTDGPTIHLQNITVRGALNTIAATHGNAVWRYDEKHCKSPTGFSINFLVW